MKPYIITIALLIVLAVILLRKKEVSRIEMIDYLNSEVGNSNGKWVGMQDDELRQVYKAFKLIKQSVRPSQEDYIKATDILKKYNIVL